ncbi:hypothetical protein [Halococcoides cellulosivorans]|uniref:Uncharacterized protein n=1 Tax=Halococcoides cellulosivorans TaxID=1679096 RepID=A0A2R4X434_9EURY|nr:hypothetical protein [Halococcoides cellulosivorans]AWB28547.1 hypothetical protein HARCEL1_13080 [Halococcoides cellulosivorans]
MTRRAVFVVLVVVLAGLAAPASADRPLDGAGTADDPYRIETAGDLAAITDDPDAHYVLTANLTLDGAETDPIGTDPPAFEGTLDGQGHAIANLSTAASDPALLGTIGANGTVRNLSLEGVDTTGVGTLAEYNDGTIAGVTVSGRLHVTTATTAGGLVAGSDGSIVGSTTSVDLALSTTAPPRHAGGLVGRNRGTLRDVRATGEISLAGPADGLDDHDRPNAGGLVATHRDGTIDSATADVTIEGVQSGGGLVRDADNASITEAHATGRVAASETAGGLVGTARDTVVRNASASVAVTGDREVGGLVGRLSEGGVVDATANGSVTGTSQVGGLVGWSQGPIVRSAATGPVRASGQRASAGGLVGEADDVVYASAATGSVEGVGAVGGLVGRLDGSIEAAYATGSVRGQAGVGGLVGVVESAGTDAASDLPVAIGARSLGPVDHTYALGEVSGERATGSLIGQRNDDTPISGYYLDRDGAPGGIGTAVARDALTGEAAASLDLGDGYRTTASFPVLDWESGDPESLESIQLRTVGNRTMTDDPVRVRAEPLVGSITATEWTVSGQTIDGTPVEETIDRSNASLAYAFPAVGNYTVRVTATGPEGTTATARRSVTVMKALGDLEGSGTATDPYRIDSARDLLAVERDPTAHYALTADIDASETADWAGPSDLPLYEQRAVDLHDERYDDPESVGFRGTFDGNNHTIDNATVAVDGLFAATDPDGTIRNLTLANATVDERSGAWLGSVAGAGLLVGAHEGQIHDVTVSGTVTAHLTAGGVAAVNEGRITDTRADVTGTAESNLGAIVGENQGVLTNVEATGTLEGADYHATVGGIAGKSRGRIADSFADVTVQGGQATGGLVGQADRFPDEQARSPRFYRPAGIYNSGAAGQVEAASGPVGGLVGTTATPVERSYAIGPVSGRQTVGGLVGYARAPIVDSYATGRVTGEEDVAGLVANLYDGGTVVRSVVATPLPGADDHAVVAAIDHDATRADLLEDVYVDRGVVSAPVDAATPVDTAALSGQNATTTLAFDFEETWQTTAGRPVLRGVDGPQIDRPTLSVRLDAEKVPDEATVTGRIVVTDVPHGLSGALFEVRTGNASVATVENVSVTDAFALTETNHTEAGMRVEVKAAAPGDDISPGSGPITLARFTLRTHEGGTTAVAPHAEEIQGLQGGAYQPIRDPATVQSIDIDVDPIDGTTPQDIDDDWKREDLDGSGTVAFPDVVVLFQHIDDPVVTDHPIAYDFNRNGRIDFGDVMALFRDV